MNRIVRVLCVFVGLMFSVSAASAETPAVIAVVHAKAQPAVVARIRAELLGVGYAVTEVLVKQKPTGQELAQVVREANGIAALVPSNNRIEVYVFERAEHKVIATVRREPQESEDTFALRAVEILRARLVNLRLNPSQQRSDAAIKAIPPQEPSLSLSTGLALLVSPGGLGAVPSLQPTLDVALTPAWSAGVFGLVAFQPSTVTALNATADISSTLLGAWGAYRIPANAWQVELGVGAGLAWLTMNGREGSPNFEPRQELVLTATALGRITIRRRVGPWLRMRADGVFGNAFPRVAVRFGEETVAQWGRPLGWVAIGPELTF